MDRGTWQSTVHGVTKIQTQVRTNTRNTQVKITWIELLITNTSLSSLGDLQGIGQKIKMPFFPWKRLCSKSFLHLNLSMNVIACNAAISFLFYSILEFNNLISYKLNNI